MAKASGNKALSAIQKLLAERVQIERWLDRLGLAGDNTPEAVREKVSRDYRKRLDEVKKELEAYGDELTKALKAARVTREGLAKRETELQEKLSEAEVRHAVGEYDENKWRQVNAEFLQSLVRIREELKNADEEIAKLEDVVDGVSEAEAEAKAAPVDELAFLKSVTEDSSDSGRASGGHRSPAPPPKTTKTEVKPAAKAKEPEKREEPPKPKVDLGASGVAAIVAGGPGKGLAATLDKSLKCKECGTMNLPTEWYCESCGAELSAL